MLVDDTTVCRSWVAIYVCQLYTGILCVWGCDILVKMIRERFCLAIGFIFWHCSLHQSEAGWHTWLLLLGESWSLSVKALWRYTGIKYSSENYTTKYIRSYWKRMTSGNILKAFWHNRLCGHKRIWGCRFALAVMACVLVEYAWADTGLILGQVNCFDKNLLFQFMCAPTDGDGYMHWLVYRIGLNSLQQNGRRTFRGRSGGARV